MTVPDPISTPAEPRTLDVRLRFDATSISPGHAAGVEVFAYGLLEGLHAIGVDVDVLIDDRDGEAWRQRMPQLGSSLRGISSPLLARSAVQRALRRAVPTPLRPELLVAALRRWRSSQVERAAADPSGGATVISYQPFHRVPAPRGSVITAHDFRVFAAGTASPVDQRILAENLDAAAAVVCSWPHPFRDCIERFGQHREKTFMIPLPVFHPPDRSVTVPATVPRRLLYPAALTPHKNHAVLLRALVLLEDVVLDLPGPPTEPEAGRLRRLAARLGVADRVCWHGFVSAAELGKLFDAASLVVVPTLWEAASGPLFEALARHLPVVASDVAPVRDQVSAYAAPAALVDPHDPEAWSKAIRQALDEPGLRTRTAEYRLPLVDRTWADVARDYGEVFAWAAGAGQRPTRLQSGVVG